jgi:type II secretory pathway predicted ATPase ExeA/septal ring-binding cell division protein DamX
MTEKMYLEHFHLKQSPFSEEPDTDIFFPEAGRSEIFKALCDDLRAGKPLIRIIGSEGSGKTMLCRLLLRRLPENDFEIVYLDNPIGSFDDLLHVVCLDLGMDPAVVPEQGILSELRVLLARRKEQEKKVVLIVDEAEKLFLAALERLMRAICEAGEYPVLHVILAGRPALDANLEQLTLYCSDVDIKTGYVLEPLTEEETGHYLNFRLMAAGLPSDSREEIFTDGAVHKIFASARGNLRLINILAEEALQASCTDKSFLVLLDHVVEQDDKSEQKTGGRIVSSDLWRNKLLLLAGGGLAVLLLLVFLFTGSGDKDTIESVSVPEQPDTVVSVTERTEPLPEQAEPSPEVQVEGAGEEEQPPAPTEESLSSFEQAAPELQTDGVVDLKPGKIKTMPASHEEAAPERDMPAASKSVAAVTTDYTSRRGEQLYQERLRASAKWLAGSYHNRYTVQLMMLASEQAAHNIKIRLVQDNFFAVKDNLYILNKRTSPPTLFVFYGTYDSMEQARQARNNMPLFLRKHHPYALSISDAMKKTED